ncbi:hypothetical protein M0802_006095 [Mischocyttarus mexicanus]|nr:hypothetical protein M0802_006095 [Mischocyttarus mexicanus]
MLTEKDSSSYGIKNCCSDSEDEMFDVDNLNEKLNKYMNQNPFRKTYFEKAESEYYFTDEFYDLFSKEKPHIVRGIEQFSNYVSFELGCIESESKREKLKQKIKDAILRIAEEDLEAKLSDIYAVG